MSSRFDNIQSRSIYVGASTNVDPALGNLIVDGNVGIGTTSPAEKLQVDGTIWAKPTSNGTLGTALKLGVFVDSSTAAYEFKTNDSTDDFLGLYSNRWGINYEIHRDSASGDKYVWSVYGDDAGHTMQLYNGNNNNTVRLSSFSNSWLNGGNVGIGTTSPSQLLTINGADGYLFTVQENGPNNSRFQIYQDNTDSALVAGYNSTSTNMTFYTGSSERLRISANGNIGIGTSSPGVKLHVVGDIGVGVSYNGGVYASTGSVSADLNWGFDFLNTSGLDDYSTRVKFYPSSGSTRKLGFWNSQLNSYMAYFDGSLNTPNFIVNAGNVGIGTSSPGSKLTVNGTGRVFYALSTNDEVVASFLCSGSSISTIGFYGTGSANDYNVRIGANVDSFIAYTNNTERMRITSVGSVGIGTTTPQAKLSVTGTSGAFNDVGIFQITSGTGASANLKLTFGVNDSGYTWIQSVLPGTDLRPLSINPSGGNVGIGTTSPAAKLDVEGGNVRTGNAFISQGGNATWSGAAIFMDWQSTYGRLGAFNYATGSWMPVNINDASIYSTGSNGNVGLGTTNPSQKLEVDGALKLTSNPSVTADSSAAYFWNQGGVGPTIGGLKFQVQTNGSTAAMTIDENQRVGIGTTSPAYKLSINGSVGIEASEEYLYFNSSYVVGSNARAKIRAVGAGGGSGYGGDLRISTRQTNNTWNEDAVTINSTGNIGIGTTTPPGNATNRAVEIVGSDSANLVVTQPGAASAAFTSYGSTAYIGTSSNHPFYLYTNNTERMRITSGGNVLVGTTTELGYKLDVNGVSLFRGSVTNTTGGFISNTNSSTDDSFWTVVSGFVGFYVNTGGYSKSTSSLITSSSGVGTMNASAILQADSNRQGFLPPRMTNTEMNAISSPAAGLVVYDTTNNKLTVYNGSTWVPLH